MKAHLRHVSSYSPGPAMASSSSGSSSGARLTWQSAENSSPGSHSEKRDGVASTLNPFSRHRNHTRCDVIFIIVERTVKDLRMRAVLTSFVR